MEAWDEGGAPVVPQPAGKRGWGLFTRRQVEKGELLAPFFGEVVANAKHDRNPV